MQFFWSSKTVQGSVGFKVLTCPFSYYIVSRKIPNYPTKFLTIRVPQSFQALEIRRSAIANYVKFVVPQKFWGSKTVKESVGYWSDKKYRGLERQFDLWSNLRWKSILPDRNFSKKYRALIFLSYLKLHTFGLIIVILSGQPGDMKHMSSCQILDLDWRLLIIGRPCMWISIRLDNVNLLQFRLFFKVILWKKISSRSNRKAGAGSIIVLFTHVI